MTRFKKPSEYTPKEPKTSLSCRIRVSSKRHLEKTAKANKMTLAELVEKTLEDYVEWLQRQE